MGFFSRKRDILAVLSRMEWGAATPEFSNEQIGENKVVYRIFEECFSPSPDHF